MANRSYLFLSDYKIGYPGFKAEKTIDASNAKYDIPLLFKILLSGSPQICQSFIFDTPDAIALVGDYDKGFKVLESFVKQISFITHMNRPILDPRLSDSIGLFRTESNRRKYFILEAGEIFEMSDIDFTQQALQLEQDINQVSREIERVFSGFQAIEEAYNAFEDDQIKQALVSTVSTALDSMGFGNWDEGLYSNYKVEKENEKAHYIPEIFRKFKNAEDQ